MVAAKIPQQGFLGQQGALVEGAADAHPHHNGGTGIGAGLLHRVQDELLDPLYPVGGAKHGDAAHVLAAEALGGHGDFDLLAGHQLHVEHGGGVVPSVHPVQGVGYHRLAQIALGVSPAHPLVHRLPEVSGDVHVLSHLQKHAGHARVLADGDAVPEGIVFDNAVQNLPGHRPVLPLPGGGDGLRHVPCQTGRRVLA